jgi:hypothetical protein
MFDKRKIPQIYKVLFHGNKKHESFIGLEQWLIHYIKTDTASCIFDITTFQQLMYSRVQVSLLGTYILIVVTTESRDVSVGTATTLPAGA